jgi:enoyl-CoA hydratase/carnithine racemase
MANIQYEKRGRTVVITMEGDTDLNIGMVGEELHKRLLEYRDDDELWCAIITGAGQRAFSAGGNIQSRAAAAQANTPTRPAWTASSTPTLMTNLELWKPLICAVNGYCLGAGLMLALACDIRIASENAEFSIPEVKTLGMVPGGGAAQRLPRIVGMGPALEILLTGDRIKADQALLWGLVNQVVPQAELMDAAMSLADRITANPPLAVRATKELVYRSMDMPLAEALRLTSFFSLVTRSTDDAKEASRAFMEKRPPQFKGQ